MMGTIGALAINPLVYPNVSYQPMRDFAPIAQLVDFREHPGPASERAGELGAGAHRAGEAEARHLELRLAGYRRLAAHGHGGVRAHGRRQARARALQRRSALALNDLLAGQIQAAFSDSVATLPHIVAGKLRALAVSSAQRLAAAPDIPTVAEAGLPGLRRRGLARHASRRPRSRPSGSRSSMRRSTRRVATPEVTQRLIAMGATITTGAPENSVPSSAARTSAGPR